IPRGPCVGSNRVRDGASMNITYDEIMVRGRAIRVPAALVDGRTVTVSGRHLRVATLKDEEWLEGGGIDDLPGFLQRFRTAGLTADILSFAGALGGDPWPGGALREANNVA